MRAVVLRPAGAGPFLLAIIAHASSESADERARLSLASYERAADFFVARGYAVVIPLRPGHGADRGTYLESAGECETAEYRRAGTATASSLDDVLRYFRKQPFARSENAIVIGHSAGGFGALALAARNPRGLRAVIAFAPGRGGRQFGRANNNCAPEKLIEAARQFGKSARVPVLSIVAENDSFFPPDLSRALADAFRAGGGRIDLRVTPAFGREGHWLFEAPESAPIWQPEVESFLRGLK